MTDTTVVDPHALTPAELEYARSGGNTDGLLKEGLIKPEDEPQPQPQQAEPQQQPAPQQQQAQQQAEVEDEDQPELDGRGRPKQRGQWVSKKALDEAREQIKQLRNEGAASKEQWARLEERFKVFQEALNAPEPREEEEEQEPALPEPDQDIIGFAKALPGHFDRRFAQFQQAIEGINQRLGQVNEQTAAQQRQNEMLGFYQQDAAAFTQKQADFGEAYRWLIANRNAELEAGGYNDPAERQRLIRADEQALVARAIEGRASPAERIYALAKARGYAPKAANGAGNGAANGANGAQPQPQQQQPQQTTVTDEISRLQKGQDAAMSLSNAGGGNRPNTISVVDLANMTDDEFRAYARKNPALVEALAGKGQ